MTEKHPTSPSPADGIPTEIVPMETVPAALPRLDREALARRESFEADPENYVTSIHLPGSARDTSGVSSMEKWLADLQSGFIDFRNAAPEAPHSKNIVWIGNDHTNIAYNVANFPVDINMKDHMVGIKTRYDKEARTLSIRRDQTGQSCDRTDEHLAKVIDAAEISINRDVLLQNPDIQRLFFLEDYDLGDTVDLTDKNFYIEDEERAKEIGLRGTSSITLKSDASAPYDLALMSPVEMDAFASPEGMENMREKIERAVVMSKSIKIPYKIARTHTDGSEDGVHEQMDVVNSFVRELETTHSTIGCANVVTRQVYSTTGELNAAYGYIIVSREN